MEKVSNTSGLDDSAMVEKTYTALRKRAGRKNSHSQKDIGTMLSLMRLNYFFQQFIHDYHDIVDDESFRVQPSKFGWQYRKEPKSGAHMFSTADRFKHDTDKSLRAGGVNYSYTLATNRRVTEPSVPTAVMSRRRANIPHIDTHQGPGPGSLLPLQSKHNNAMYIDSSVGRFDNINRVRTDVGPSTYHVRCPPLGVGYVPRFDGTLSRAQRDRVLGSQTCSLPGPGAYNPKRIDDKYVPAPKYLTASPRKTKLSDIDLTTPGIGSYNIDMPHSSKAFSFPSASRNMLSIDATHEKKLRSRFVLDDAQKHAQTYIIDHNIALAKNFTPSQRAKSQQEMAKKRRHWNQLSKLKRNLMREQFEQRALEWKILNEDTVEASDIHLAREILTTKWSIISVHAIVLSKLCSVLKSHRASVLDSSIEPRSAKVIQRQWRQYVARVEPRRLQLRLVLVKSTFRFALQARIIQRRRAIMLIREFFSATEHLSKSYMTSVIRNFRRSIVTIQTFWRKMMWKMEHQLLLWMIQWLRFEEGQSSRAKETIQQAPTGSQTLLPTGKHAAAGQELCRQTPNEALDRTSTHLENDRSSTLSLQSWGTHAAVPSYASNSGPGQKAAAAPPRGKVVKELSYRSFPPSALIASARTNCSLVHRNVREPSSRPSESVPKTGTKNRLPPLLTSVNNLESRTKNSIATTDRRFRNAESVPVTAGSASTAVRICPPVDPEAREPPKNGGVERPGSLYARALQDIIDDVSSRGFISNQVKAKILRDHMQNSRHLFWRRKKEYEELKRQWLLDEESRDSVVDKARRIIQGGLPEKTKTDASFAEKHLPPFFHILLSHSELIALIRIAHSEQVKLNTRNRRRERLRTSFNR